MSSTTQPQPTISHAAATALVAAVRDAATEAGVEVAVAVTDVGGHLKAFERTDGTPFLAATVAVDKAWTAASFRLSTHVWNQYLQDPAVGPLGSHPRLLAVGGGYPLVVDGETVGGLGVSGGTAQEDQDAAEQAMRAGGFDLAG